MKTQKSNELRLATEPDDVTNESTKMLESLGSAKTQPSKAVIPNKVAIPRVASLGSLRSGSVVIDEEEKLAKVLPPRKQRDRLDEASKRFYDPLTAPVRGRDSPGINKYESLSTIGVKSDLRADSRIQASEFYSIPKARRVLKWNTGNGQGAANNFTV